MTARDDVLARIRGALGEEPFAPEVVRTYRTHGEYAAGAPELVLQLIDRLEDYKATVVRSPDASLVGAAVAKALSDNGVREAIVPAGLPPEWSDGIARVVTDDGTLDARALDPIPAVVTGSVVAVAETGTIVLDGGPMCGRRAITLVPDLHVCVVQVQDVVQTVPEGLRLLDPSRPLTFISGPSATSDIELSRVEGVHGPRTLIVVLAGADVT